MLKKLITAVMKNERDPELAPLRITKNGYIQCTSGIFFGMFKFNTEIDGELHQYDFQDDFYLNYKTFVNVLYPTLGENPKLLLKDNHILQAKSKKTNLKLNLLMPFEDYIETLNYMEKEFNDILVKTGKFVVKVDEFKNILKITNMNMKIAKTLSTHKDLDYIKLINKYAVSISPISLLAVKCNSHLGAKYLPGELIRIIQSTDPLYIMEIKDYFLLEYHGGNFILCKKLEYEEIDYKDYLTSTFKKTASIDLNSIKEFMDIIQTIDSSYWVKNLEIRGKSPVGIIVLKSPIVNIKRKIRISSGGLNIKISPKIFNLIYKLKLSEFSDTEQTQIFTTVNKDVVFVIAKESNSIIMEE